MKKFLFVLTVIGTLAACQNPNTEATPNRQEDLASPETTVKIQDSPDALAIKEVVTAAYVQGVHINREPEDIREGFDPQFVMFISGGESSQVTQLKLNDWITRIESSKEANPERPEQEITHEFSMVDVTGNVGVAKIEIYKAGQHLFTDYMSLYKDANGWKIVSKVFERHK